MYIFLKFNIVFDLNLNIYKSIVLDEVIYRIDQLSQINDIQFELWRVS